MTQRFKATIGRLNINNGRSALTKFPDAGVITYEEYGFSPLSHYLAVLGRPQTSPSDGLLPKHAPFSALGVLEPHLVALDASLVRGYADPTELARLVIVGLELLASWGKPRAVLDLTMCEDEPTSC